MDVTGPALQQVFPQEALQAGSSSGTKERTDIEDVAERQTAWAGPFRYVFFVHACFFA